MTEKLKHGDRVPFVQIANAMLCDPALSFQEKGMLSLMLSKPEDWAFSLRSIAEEAKEDKDTVGRIMQRLIAAGYVTRAERPRVQGRLMGYDYTVYQSPRSGNPDTEDAPCPQNPDTVNGDTPNTVPTNKNTEGGVLVDSSSSREAPTSTAPPLVCVVGEEPEQPREAAIKARLAARAKELAVEATAKAADKRHNTIDAVIDGFASRVSETVEPEPMPLKPQTPKHIPFPELLTQMADIASEYHSCPPQPTVKEKGKLRTVAKQYGASAIIAAWRQCQTSDPGKRVAFFLEDTNLKRYRSNVPRGPSHVTCPSCGNAEVSVANGMCNQCGLTTQEFTNEIAVRRQREGLEARHVAQDLVAEESAEDRVKQAIVCG